MALGRKMTRVVISPGKPGRVRYAIDLTGEDCPPNTLEARLRQQLFLHWIADNQELLKCGLSDWQTISIKHDGVCWKLHAEAEVDEDVDGE